ncbi:MAG: DUF1405 domain-containing protein [Clostridia bacterium]|jgi:uncharacterized membrane protein YpjA|nr:DUF1405 domain-containing protein [Clostridia bacterium]
MKHYLLWIKHFNGWRQFFLDPRVLKIILFINILGSIYGYYWYRVQLQLTPLRFWIFIPDSPLSTTLFSIAIFLILCKRKFPFLYFLAFITVIKYGLWAVFVNTHFWLLSGQVHWVEFMLWLSHLGMALEGIIYLRLFLPSLYEWGVVGFWMMFNDYVDYAWDLHPYLYLQAQLPVVEVFTYCLTFVLLFMTIIIVWRVKS